MSCITHKIEEQIPEGIRLDRYVSETLSLLSRSQIKARNLKAKVNGKDVKISRLVKQGDLLELNWDEEPPVHIIPQDIPLEIIYEDERCIVVNKAQGMVVHPGAGNRQGTLANAVLFRIVSSEKGAVSSEERTKSKEQLAMSNGARGFRAGIVHRLDKETSGVIICAYDEQAHAFLAEQFKERKVRKTYIAIVCGVPKEVKGRIETFIARDPKERKRFAVSSAGKHAITYYKVLKNWKGYSLVLLRPRTGRTHQLRVHLKYIGCPILGDPVYCYSDKNFPDATLMLHSKSLAITLPGEASSASQPEEHIFTSPPPQRFIEIIERLSKLT
jgi:23S rRNA pseudouridine1911/1915/1917 synthase